MTTDFSLWNVRDQLKTPEDCAAFVGAAFVEAGDDTAFIVKALGEVAKCSCMAGVAREDQIFSNGLLKAVVADENPSFSAMMRLIRALGLEIHFTAAKE